jgi:copper(I)-binding protein
MKRAGKIFCWVVLIAAAVACQSKPPRITIERAAAELSPSIYGEAMVSMTIRNQGGADALTGAKINIAGATVSLHSMDGQRMVVSNSMKVPARGALELTMQGSHIMIENMPKDVKEGTPVTLTLIFAKSGERKIEIVLKKAAPMPMSGGGHQM